MRTLLVPCAGSRQINHLPVFLNQHPDGKLLAEKCLEGIFSEGYDRILFSILKKVDKEYDARRKILDALCNKYPVEVICLPEETNGPAETVYQSLKIAGVVGEFAVRDCLNSIQLSKDNRGNFVAGLDLTSYEQDVYKVKTKSFIITNEQNQILDIIEKKFRSDVISVGLYGFKNVMDYVMAYEKLSDKNYPIKKLYLSNIISFLLGYSQRIFHYVQVIKHEDWGSLETWNLLQRYYATCILDADSILGEELSEETTERLANLLTKHGRGNMSYIILTTNNELDIVKLRAELCNNNIKCVGVINGISYSKKHILISTQDELRMSSLEI